MKNNKLLKSLALVGLTTAFFIGAAHLVSAADDNKDVKTEMTQPSTLDQLGIPDQEGSGSMEVPEIRPGDPEPSNPNAKDVPGNGQPSQEVDSNSTSEKSVKESKTVRTTTKKVLPKTSAVN